MEKSLLINEMERRIGEFKSEKEYDCADALIQLKVQIDQGYFYGTIYDRFTKWTGDDVTFTDDEKKKFLYLLIKNHHKKQYLSERSYCIHRNILEVPCVLQATINKKPHTEQDEVHVVISGGHGYNEYGSDEFKELLIHF